MAAIRSSLISGLDWVEHGFGTRDLEPVQGDRSSLKQVHSGKVLIVQAAGCAGEGDALVTNQPGIEVSIRTADCFPILLADPGRRVVAAVHAGWRGTAARIASNTIAIMRAEFGTNPADIVAAIGPGIGACCYQVGEEVARQFGMDRAGRLDLAAENRRELVAGGVAESRIEVLGLCTFCDPARFHSYRRDKESAGRMISGIRIRR